MAAIAAAAVLSTACAGSSLRPPASRKSVPVTVLTTTSCGQTEAAVEQVTRVAARLGIATSVERVLVETPEAASRLRFLGSPTIQVSGKDLDPTARDRTDYGFS
jgi:K+-transporting ATPase c subunit